MQGHFLTRPLPRCHHLGPLRENREQRRHRVAEHRREDRARRAYARGVPVPALRLTTPPPRPERVLRPAQAAAERSALAEASRDRRQGVLRLAKVAGLLSAAVIAGALVTVCLPDSAQAQARRTRLKPQDLTLKGSVAARPLVLVGALAVLSLLPFVIIMVTSFVKISVVLSIVRSAIGTQQIPPTQVITGMATILTVYIMTPVGLEIYKVTENMIQERRPGSSLVSAETVDLIFDAMVQAKGPVTAFLAKNSHIKDRAMFFSMAKRLRKPEDRSGVGPDDLMILVPSFVISELKEAFQIGFIIFVPFLVIDMIVSNILMALGMQMLSPTTISLPFKLLLFVMIDGWYLITKGLIMGYI